MVDITHYLELGDPSHSSCLAEAALLPAPRIESYRGIQPISLDLGVALLAVRGHSYTPTPWLTLLLVLGKSRVKQNSC